VEVNEAEAKKRELTMENDIFAMIGKLAVVLLVLYGLGKCWGCCCGGD
jgi:hypothetical protein